MDMHMELCVKYLEILSCMGRPVSPDYNSQITDHVRSEGGS